MKKSPFLFLLSLLAVFSLLLAGCGGGANTAEEPAAAEEAAAEEPAAVEEEAAAEEPAAAEETAERKVATFIWTQEFDSLNPIYTNMWFSTITQQIWNCDAWDWDDQSNPHPVLISEIPSLENGGISEDGKTLTFKLRDDIIWSDGEPITSADFLFTYEMYTSSHKYSFINLSLRSGSQH